MFNFGVQVVKEMETEDKQYLGNIQVALGQKEIDLEDALIVEAQRCKSGRASLMVKRKAKRRL